MLALLGPLPWDLLAATLLVPFLLQAGLASPAKAKHNSLRREKTKGKREKSKKKKRLKAQELVGFQMVLWGESWLDKGTETVPAASFPPWSAPLTRLFTGRSHCLLRPWRRKV